MYIFRFFSPISLLGLFDSWRIRINDIIYVYKTNVGNIYRVAVQLVYLTCRFVRLVVYRLYE